MKEVVVDIAPKRIKGLEFSALSASDIVGQSKVEISTRDLFDLENGRKPKSGGALDTRMGVSSSQAECSTCHGNLASCHGHFGHIKLAFSSSLPRWILQSYYSSSSVDLQELCGSASKRRGQTPVPVRATSSGN